ncbi:DUF6504 family protein [Nocardioides mesophilus]|uniref:DUF6504 domain-containing protein n=1 Tax=Nocardioides mesophilus TaxID=433659 RepID=A0A7G9RBY2_9ACTN|nr:DUF6504 family protein [Nocardioides mesophilus]QNN53107.1 hypothetical protein H9L09_00980 [Nocardioides mesophilus]
MRRYDDPVEVRRGMVAGPGGRQEGPEQFLWKGRLWKVCEIEAHWVETGPWWQSGGVRAVLGSDTDTDMDMDMHTESRPASGSGSAGPGGGPSRDLAARDLAARDLAARDLAARDLAAEREIWRVEAARGLAAAGAGRGVFDLTFDWASGSWLLTRCAD